MAGSSLGGKLVRKVRSGQDQAAQGVLDAHILIQKIPGSSWGDSESPRILISHLTVGQNRGTLG